MQRKFLIFIFLCIGNILVASEKNIEDVVILGGGPSGLSAAIFAGRELLSPLVIESSTLNSEMLMTPYSIENYPGFPDAVSSFYLHRRTREQASDFGARFKEGTVVEADLRNKPYQLTFDNGEKIYCNTLVIATGARPKKLNFASEEELHKKGVMSYVTSNGISYENKNVVIVGGGDAAVSKAIELAPTASKITLIFLGDKMKACRYLQKRAAAFSNIEYIPNSTINDIYTSDNRDTITGVNVINEQTKNTKKLSTEKVIVAIGIEPRSHLFQGQIPMDQEGYILTLPDSTMTRVPGVFAVGDVGDPDPDIRKLITACGTGARAGMEVFLFLSKEQNQ